MLHQIAYGQNKADDVQVFLSYASKDVELVRKLQQALESRNIKTSSMLDVPAGERWSQKMDQASASADAFIFLLATGASANPHLPSRG